MKDIERRSETMLHDSLQQIPLLRADLVKRRQQHRRQQRKKMSPRRQTHVFYFLAKCCNVLYWWKPMLKLQNLVLKPGAQQQTQN